MKLDLLDLICCPTCYHSLEVVGPPRELIVDGNLKCTHCGTEYSVKKGMPFLHKNDETWEPKAKEAQGWVELWKEQGIYEKALETEDSFKLPYLGGELWDEVARMFDIGVHALRLNGSETILDLGAGQGWAAKYFALRGCRSVAIDILPDERLGLGRARAIMDQAGTYFETVIGDNENLPFKEGVFDIVFSCGSLHHSLDMIGLLRSARRVLKRGGRLVAVGEPAITVFDREKDVQATLRETEVGIVERRPTVMHYCLYLRLAGFSNIEIDCFETYEADQARAKEWMVAARHNLYHHSRRRSKWLKWLLMSVVLRLPWRLAIFPTLMLNGANLILQAKK